MFGFLFTAVALIMMALLAMKLVPAYIEYFSVKKISDRKAIPKSAMILGGAPTPVMSP